MGQEDTGPLPGGASVGGGGFGNVLPARLGGEDGYVVKVRLAMHTLGTAHVIG